MKTEDNRNRSNDWAVLDWILLVAVLLFIAVVLKFFQQQNQQLKKESEILPYNQHEWYDNNRRPNYWNNEGHHAKNEDQESRAFQQKGYLFNSDIQQLKSWGLKVNEVPDLKAKKRRGVINTLAVNDETEKGFCSELVIILKESPHVNNYNLDSMKINQSKEFANTRNNNEVVIRFAIDKLIKKGYKWKYDVYVLKANNRAATVCGPSAGSGVYMALLSAFYSDCAIPQNLAITGSLETNKKEIPVDIKPVPKKYQWHTNRCTQCRKFSQFYHFIYNKATGKLEQSYLDNATDPDCQWVFCTYECYEKWWNENVYNCSECYRQRFGSCSCCGKYYYWTRKNNSGNKKFCSKNCLNEYYPKAYEEGKILAIGGIGGKISAAVEKGCDTIIIPKSNSSNYYSEVPLFVRTKVKKLYEVEDYNDLENLFRSGL